jgi:hypothetical protein
MFKYLLTTLLLLSVLQGEAQQTKATRYLDALSLQNLMNIKLIVLYAQEPKLEESPFIASDLTAVNFRSSGARNLKSNPKSIYHIRL